MSPRPVRVLVVDDSAQNRRALAQLLGEAEDVEVVDRAGDGEEGLRKAIELRPDVITLDLEMPRLDGFAFLRLLRATAPTPVIVVSSYAHRADVFKALELGAFDFVAKPRRAGKEDLAAVKQELLEKIRAARQVRPEPRRSLRAEVAPVIVAVAASTGGPGAIERVVGAVSAAPALCLLVCQHMPSKFTRSFAERLDRLGAMAVREAKEGDRPAAGHAFIAPGGRHLELARREGALELQTPAPWRGEKHAPSADRLFSSVAAALAARAVGVVLTGMGADGAAGVRAIDRAGGEVWAEAERSSVIFGMPSAAIGTGAVKRVLELDEIGPALVSLVKRRSR
jgi:two-component system chemotaxis response regulator CheB